MTKYKTLINATRLIVLILSGMALAGCSSDTVVEFDVNGVVAEVHPDEQLLVVLHDEIPGYMSAMQMPFPVARPELLEGLQMGDQVDFHLTVTNATALITAVDRLPSYSGPLPSFNLESRTGEMVSSSEFLGKVTVLNFWASWCAPCKTEMPILNQMVLDYPESDFQVVGITQDPESRDAIDAIIEELGILYPILMTDTEHSLEIAIGGVPVIPGTIVVDKSGQVVDKRLGLVDEQILRDLVESLL